MLNSSTLKILSTFDNNEFKKFEDFIKSPFFNKNNNVKKIFCEIKKYYPSFENNKLESEQLWQKIFPGKKYNYGIMKNLVYNLHKLSENFLMQIGFEKNNINKSNLLLSEFSIRNLQKQFEKESKTTIDKLEHAELDSRIYFDKLNFETIYNGFYLNNKVGLERYRSFSKMNSYLLESFFIHFFDKNFHSAFANNYMKIDYDNDFVNYLLEYFNKCSEKSNEEILIFYYLFKIAMDINDTDSFYRAKSLVEKNSGKYVKKQLYFFYTRLTDYCDNRISFDKEFSIILFDIYNKMLKKNLWNNGLNMYIHPMLYMGIICAALNCNKIEWAESFMNEFKNKLHPDYQQNYYDKGNINYLFHTKQFDKALEFLSKIKITTPFDKASIKMLQFKIYYELNCIEELILLIDSSKHYISKDKNISEELKIEFLNYTLLMKKLISIKNIEDNDKKLSLKNFKVEISGIDIFDKVWFNEKINEMEKGFDC